MKLPFWKRPRIDDAKPSEGEVALAAARRRLGQAGQQLRDAHDVKRHSERTKEINHWSEMMVAAWAAQNRRR